MSKRPDDEFFMGKALQLARKGLGCVGANPLVGAVIVKGDEITGRGYQRAPEGIHAEVDAIRKNRGETLDSTLYVNLEPCCYSTTPCTTSLIQHRFKRIVIGAIDPDPRVNGRGLSLLKEHGIDVEVGVLTRECERLNEVYFKYIREGLPFVTVKFAQTLDGRIASKTRHSQWISSDASLRFVHKLRSINQAVMIGIGTVLQDDPRLTVRLTRGKNPCRIVVDSSLRIPLSSKVITQEENSISVMKRRKCCEEGVILATTPRADKEKITALEEMGAQVLVIKENSEGQVDLKELLYELGRRGISSVMVEGGAKIITSLLRLNLLDKLVVVVAPKILGKGIEAVGDLGIRDVNQALRFSEVKMRRLGIDFIFEGRFAAS